MKIYLLLIASVLSIQTAAFAEEAKPTPETKQNIDVPISKEIKELSNKEIFGNYKKSVIPVKINEPTGSQEDISIIYDSPRKPLPSNDGQKFTSALGFKVKDTDPNDISTLTAFAYKAAISGQSEAALTLYKKALLKDNNNTNVLFALASLYQRLSQYKEAKIHYKKLLTVDPDYKKALNNYLVLMSEESPGQALAELKEMEKANPDFSPIQAQIGMIYAQMGDYASAEKYLHRSIILAPEVLHYRYNLAVVYDNMKKYPEAVAVYKQILDAGAASEVLPQNSNSIRNRMTYLQEKLAIHRE